MAIESFQLGTSINNDSLQVGDYAFYIEHFELGCFDTSGETAVPKYIGIIVKIPLDNRIEVDVTGDMPGVGDFLMFAKDTSINLSGLLGYYAEVQIKNNSRTKAEMYCMASEISVSSK